MFKPISHSASPLFLAFATVAACVSTGIYSMGTNCGCIDPSKKPKAGEERKFEITKDVFMVFCWIPSGEAQLGSSMEEQKYIIKTFYDGKRPIFLDNETEAKRGKFKTKGFWLGKYTVTQAEWKAVMGGNPSWFQPNGDGKLMLRKDKIRDTSHFPVEQVSWNDCQIFLEKLNKRTDVENVFGKAGRFVLPHEDQWEYACRGGKGNKQAFYFGNELNGTQANCNGGLPYGTDEKGDYKNRTTEVGSYAKEWPHPWGLSDMHGNVLQWCDNKYEGSDYRILRGGCAFVSSLSCRSAYRSSKYESNDCFYDFGFRVCLPLDLE
jgi:formylglycine-generating enzyme required for sulfatase activity